MKVFSPPILPSDRKWPQPTRRRGNSLEAVQNDLFHLLKSHSYFGARKLAHLWCFFPLRTPLLRWAPGMARLGPLDVNILEPRLASPRFILFPDQIRVSAFWLDPPKASWLRVSLVSLVSRKTPNKKYLQKRQPLLSRMGLAIPKSNWSPVRRLRKMLLVGGSGDGSHKPEGPCKMWSSCHTCRKRRY